MSSVNWKQGFHAAQPKYRNKFEFRVYEIVYTFLAKPEKLFALVDGELVRSENRF